MKPTAVLFVCLGNICRSPTADIVFRRLAQEQGLEDRFVVDSAGTGNWHIGKPPHLPAQQAAKASGYDMSVLQARQVQADDFYRFDYILAMDSTNLANLRAICPADFSGYLGSLLDFSPASDAGEIADPYGGDEADFERAFREIEVATRHFFHYLLNRD